MSNCYKSGPLPLSRTAEESQIDRVLSLVQETENKQENHVDARHRSRIRLYTDGTYEHYLWPTNIR